MSVLRSCALLAAVVMTLSACTSTCSCPPAPTPTTTIVNPSHY